MTVTATPAFVQACAMDAIVLTSADTTVAATLLTAPAGDGVLLRAINVATDDTTDVDVDVILNDGATDYYLGTRNVPAGSGRTAESYSIDALHPDYIAGLDANGELWVPGGWTVKVACQATMTAAMSTYVVANAAAY